MSYSPVRHSPPGRSPRCRSTCMCKACRQRSIWARIKLFSSISCTLKILTRIFYSYFRTNLFLCLLSFVSFRFLTFACRSRLPTLVICHFFNLFSRLLRAFCLSRQRRIEIMPSLSPTCQLLSLYFLSFFIFFYLFRCFSLFSPLFEAFSIFFWRFLGLPRLFWGTAMVFATSGHFLGKFWKQWQYNRYFFEKSYLLILYPYFCHHF